MAVPIAVRILPLGRAYGRPGYKLVGERTITIHNTENPDATAENHADYLESGRAISWHFTVDADSAVQHLPLDEQGWHAGTTPGNTTSIGIEICEYTDPALTALAIQNGAWLAAKLCHDLGLFPGRAVVTHQSWMQYGTSGKYCPHLIIPQWGFFLAEVTAEYYGMEAPMDFPEAPTGWLRFYRLRGGNGNFFYTSSQDEARKSGHEYEGVGFDVSLTDPTNTLPLHRLWLPEGFHFYTASAEEYAIVKAREGVRDEGIVAYVGTRGASVKRLAQGDAHLYTVSNIEAQNAAADHWLPEGVAFSCGIEVAPPVVVPDTWKIVEQSFSRIVLEVAK
ncbi:MAG: hypothetical protein HGA39_04075 [Coriobacteriia bacterium]|nr:hypothetical protein [Coriobacteriia bacterium]